MNISSAESYTPLSLPVAGTGLAALLLAAMLIAATQSVSAQSGSGADTQATPAVSSCKDVWSLAPAASYCEAEAIQTNPGTCGIKIASCSITVNVDNSSTTFSKQSLNMSVAENDTDDVDLCFALSGGSYSMDVKAGCGSDETASASAVNDGLSTTTTSVQ